jgi:CheY-like chemotaxis protein
VSVDLIEADNNLTEFPSSAENLPAIHRCAPRPLVWNDICLTTLRPAGRGQRQMKTPTRDDISGTVLVVDDTEDNLALTIRSLQRAGIRCLKATRGLQCLEVVKNNHVDLILLDLIMPHMDGWATLGALRHDPATSNIAVVMFTCDDRVATRERAMKEGAVDFLPRPVARERLLACVRMHLQAVARARAIEAIDRGLDVALSRDAGRS